MLFLFSALLALLAGVVQPSAASAEAAGKTPEQLARLAEKELFANNLGASLRLYSESLALKPDPRVYFGRHKVHLKQQKMGRAIADLTAAIEQDGAYLTALTQRAKLYVLTGRCQEAVQDYELVLRKDASKRDAKAGLPTARKCQAAMERLLYAQRSGNWHGVRESATVALTDEASGGAGATQSALLFLARADAHFKLGELESALADTARCLKLDPNNLRAYVLRARALTAHGDYSTARTHYGECINQGQEGLEAAAAEGAAAAQITGAGGINLQAALAECKEGFKTLKTLLKLQSAGDEAMKRGQWDEALLTWQEALRLPLEQSGAWHREVLPKLAKTQLQRKDFQGALAVARRAIERSEQQQGGRQHQQQQGEEVQGCPQCYSIAAEALLGLEQWEEAIKFARRAHEMDRGNGEYRGLLQRAEAALKQSKQKNYYSILGVARNADVKVIKKAYRALALEWHPDKHNGLETATEAEKRFKDIQEAYDVLSDEEKRGRYDRGEEVEGQQGPPRGHPFGGGGMPFFFQGGGPRGHPGGGGGGFHFHFG